MYPLRMHSTIVYSVTTHYMYIYAHRLLPLPCPYTSLIYIYMHCVYLWAFYLQYTSSTTSFQLGAQRHSTFQLGSLLVLFIASSFFFPVLISRSLGGGAGFTQLVDARPSSPRPRLTDPDRRLPLASAASSAASAASDASASPAAASSVSLRGVVGGGYVQESATVLLAGVQAAWRSRLECARGSGGFSSPAHPAGRHPQLRRRPFSTHIAGAAPPGLNLRPPAPILNDPSPGPFLNRPIADSAQFDQPVLLCVQSSPTQANSVRQRLSGAPAEEAKVEDVSKQHCCSNI